MSGPSFSRGRPWTLASALFVLFVLAVYAPALVSRRNFAGRDLLVYHLPIERAVHEAYSRGRFPLWITEISGGRPLAANPNVGAFYPLRPLLAPLSFPLAMRLFPIIHWAIAGIGMLLLLRSLDASAAAGWIGAVTYAFCGPAVTEVFYPNIQPGMTLLPWVVWAVNRGRVSEGAKLLSSSLVFAFLFLAGDVFAIGVAIVGAVLWIVLERPATERVREILLLGVAFLLAGLLAAPQVVAAALWVPETNRGILGMKLGESLSFSLSPLRLLELVVPFPFGPTWSLDDSLAWGWPVFHQKTIGFFTTLYSGAFAVVALAASRKWRAPGVRFARILFVLGVLVTVTPSFLPRGWAGRPSPLPLRYPEKFSVAIVLALALLSGLAFDHLRRRRPLPRWTLAVGILFAAAAGSAALFPQAAGRAAVRAVGVPPAGERLPEAPPDPVSVAAREIAPALAEGGILWLLTVVALDRLHRPGLLGAGLSLFLLTLVPVWANRRIANTVRTEEVVSPSAFARFLRRADPAREYRALGEPYYLGVSKLGLAQWATDPPADLESWVVYRHALAGRGTIFNFDFDVGDFARVESLRRLSSLAVRQGSGAFFETLGLKWGIRFRDQEPVPGYRRFRQNDLHAWDVLAGALPDVRLAGAWREVPGPVEAAGGILALDRGQILLETGREGSGRAAPGAAAVVRREPDRLEITTEAPEPAWLFVLRGFWSHRTVLVDGRPAECVPAQLAFSAVPVPAGRHRIEWREHLPGSPVSRWGPVLFGALMGGLLVRDAGLRRSKRRAAR